MAIGISSTVDFAFKKIFGSDENEVALIGLLNAILQPERRVAFVEIQNPFSMQDFQGEKPIVLDLKAKGGEGSWFNVEMQVTPHRGLLPRLTFYACNLFLSQIGPGEDYYLLRPALSICFLGRSLFDDQQGHHRFQLMDRQSGEVLQNGIEVHTVELRKYNAKETQVVNGSPIEKWAFFLSYADQYEASRLREIFPEAEFQRAIQVLEVIAQKSENREVYDQRIKNQMDWQWMMGGAREEGREEGRREGIDEGLARGRLIGQIQLLAEMLEDEIALTELHQFDQAALQAKLNELQERFRTGKGYPNPEKR